MKKNKYKAILKASQNAVKNQKYKVLDELRELGVPHPKSAGKNNIAGGRIYYANDKNKAFDILKDNGIKTIISLKAEYDDPDYQRYSDDCQKAGFNFVPAPAAVIDVSLSYDTDFSASEDFIKEFFVNWLFELKNTLNDGACYMGCEYGTARTELVLYYLSAITDKIQKVHYSPTKNEKATFAMLQQINQQRSLRNIG